MSIELVPVMPEHIEELGGMHYEAFKGIADRFSVPPISDSVASSQRGINWLTNHPKIYGVAALEDGKLVGAAYVSMRDEVAAVGPVFVSPLCQGKGIGRILTQNVVNQARQGGFERIRLVQDAVNVSSLSLYISLGFDVKETMAFMRPKPISDSVEGIRLANESDLPAIERLSRDIYKISRRNEVAEDIYSGDPVLLLEREYRITGYFLPGMDGHGVAEDDEDMLALIGEAAARFPELSRFHCPLSQASQHHYIEKS